jgi:uncharacterized protein YuzE
MRVTYDPEVDAVYVYLTDEPLRQGRDSVPCDPHENVQYAFVVMDWKDGKIVGLEILDGSKLLHPDLIATRATEAPWVCSYIASSRQVGEVRTERFRRACARCSA